MEILQLRYFCDAAKTQNFSKTAKKYNVPPSNISQSVHRLEREVGAELFVRSANRISLNEKGEAFYKKIKAALDSIDEAKSIISDFDGEIRGEIRMQVCADRRIVTQVIEKFKQNYPAVTFAITHNTNADGSFDIVISDDVVRYRNMKKTLLLEENIAVAAKNDSAAADTDDLSLLSEERYITMPEGSSMWRITKEICKKHGFEANIAIQSDDPFYVRKYVGMGLGIAFVPMLSWQGQFDENVCLKKIEGESRKVYLFTSNEKYVSKAVRKFCSMLTAECREI